MLYIIVIFTYEHEKNKEIMVRTRRPKTKKNPQGCGRIGQYQPWMVEEAKELCSKLGARNKDLAEYFDVKEITIEHWIRHKPDFARAVKRGRFEAGLKVADSLYNRAIGYSHRDTKHFQHMGDVISVPTMKHYPPDVGAASRYLSIVFREIWAEQNTVNVNNTYSGSIDVKHINELPIEDLTKQQQDLIFGINMKQLTQGAGQN